MPTQPSRRRRTLPTTVLLSLAISSSTLGANVGFWTATTGQWTDLANWTSPSFPNGLDDAAIFESPGTSTITLSAPITLGAMTFDASTYTLNASTAGSLTFASSTSQSSLLLTSGVTATTAFSLPVTLASNLLITNNATSPLLFSGPLSGTGNLILNGKGEVNLRGTNSAWTPASITLNAGLLSTVSGTFTSLGDPTSGTITVNAGASLDISGIVATSTTQQFTKSLILSGSGTPASPGALSFGATTSTLLGSILLNGPTTFNAKAANSLLHIGDSAGAPSSASLSGTGPLIKAGTGNLQINIPATYTGGTQVNAGSLIIGTTGSLVGTGNITLNNGGRLLLRTPAGPSPATNSISPNSIILSGGLLSIATDISLANILSPASTSGVISIENATTFTAGGTNTIDLSSLPVGSAIRLGATAGTILPAGLTLIPDASHTLHFTAFSGGFTLAAAINDTAGIPTNVEFGVGASQITISGSNTYTGFTSISIPINLTNVNALGTPAGQTFINPSGTLTISVATAEPLTNNGGFLQISALTSGNLALNAGTTFVSTPGVTSPVLVSGGTFNLNAWLNSTLQASGGIVNVNATSSQQILVTGGLVNMANASTSPITVSAGTLRLNSGSTLLAHSVTLNGGRLSLSINTSIANLLNAATTGGTLLIDSGGTFTSGSDNMIDFSTLPGGTNLTLGSSISSTIGINTTLKPDNTTHTLHFGGAGATATLTLSPALTDFSSIPTNISVSSGSTIFLQTANTYSGITTIDGLVQVNHVLGLGVGTGVDADGTVVNQTGRLSTGPGVILANEKITLNRGTLSLNSAGPIVVTAPSALAGNYTGTISGSGSITVNGNTTLSGTNSFTGNVTIIGTIGVNVNSPTGLGDTNAGTTISFGGTLNLNAMVGDSLAITGSTVNFLSGGTYGGSITLGAAGGTIGGNHNLTTLTNTLQLNGGNTALLGDLVLSGGVSGAGSLTVGAPSLPFSVTINGLLSNSVLFSLKSGTLTLNTTNSLSNPITVTAATLIVNNAPSVDSLTINGGTSGQASPVHFNGPVAVGLLNNSNGATTFAAAATVSHLTIVLGVVTFNGPAYIGTLDPGNGGGIVLNGPAFLPSPLATGGSYTVSAPLTVSGTIVVRGALTLNGANVIQNPVVVGGRTLTSSFNVNANNLLPSLFISDNGSVNIAPTATLTLQSPEIAIRSGGLSGAISGISTIRKISPGIAGLSKLGPGASASVIVEKGTLAVDGAGSGTITVQASTGAFLNIGASSRTILLNNALGDAYPTYGNGAVLFTGTFSGLLDLGSIGSAISVAGNNGGPVVISGSITGTSLIVMSSGTSATLSLENSTSTYTGLTRLYSAMQLANSGKLISTSEVVLYNGGNLIMAGNGNLDQLSDNIPIIGEGGSLTLVSYNNSPPIQRSEGVGVLSAVKGNSALVLKPGYGANSIPNSVFLTLGDLNRSAGATVSFVEDFGTANPPDANSHFFIGTPPALHNGIIGGWAVFQRIPGAQFIDEPPDFATYGGGGVGPAAYYGAINSAASTDNVSVGVSPPVSASKTINSLRVIGGTVDLAGNILTLDSGGLILFPTHLGGSPDGKIQNGTLVPTASSNGELVITGQGTISANIPDYPGGSTQLTIAGYGITLGGSNTFTGPIHVASGQIIFNSLSAIPVNSSLFLDGGGAYFNFTSGTVVAFNSITTGPNYVQIGASGTPLTLNVASYDFNQVDLFVALTGNGPMTISGHTIINQSGGNLVNYSGNIVINDGGILTLLGLNAFTASLGTGNVTVNLGGQILVKYSMTGNVILNGGRLQNGIGFAGSVHVTANSTIADLPVTGPITIDSAAQLTLEDCTTQSISGGSILTPRYATATTDRITSLILTVNGTHIIRPNNSSPSIISTLTLAGTPNAWTAKLDLNNNNLIVTGGGGTNIPNQLKQAANLGSWNGTAGISSSSAQLAATTSTATALAYATGSQFTTNSGQTTFSGQPFNLTDTLIMYTLAGDANMEGSVTFADFLQLQNHYNQAGTDWQGGDFNYDGSTTFADFLILQNNYNKTLPSGPLLPATPGQIPEPTTALLLLLPLLLKPRRQFLRHAKP